MEISGNLRNPYLLSSQSQTGSDRASVDQGFLREQIAADKRTSGSDPREQLTRDQAVQSKEGANYTEVVQRTLIGQARENIRRVTPSAQASLGVRRALDAYQSTANDLEGRGVDLLPRVDRYV